MQTVDEDEEAVLGTPVVGAVATPAEEAAFHSADAFRPEDNRVTR